MASDKKRWASVGFYISIISALITAGMYFVGGEFDTKVQLGLGLVVLGFASYLIWNPDQVRQLISGRQARYGSNAFVMLIAVLGIVVMVNYIAYKNPQTWDLTESQANTLAPETIELLESLESPVELRAYVSPGSTNVESLRSVLDNFAANSNGQFKYEFIDPNENPVAAKADGVSQSTPIVLQMGERKQRIKYISEQEIDGALLALIGGKSPKVYFLTGHGERDLDAPSDLGFSKVRNALEGRNYQVEVLNLLAEGEIPEDAEVIVVAGPQLPVTEREVAQIKEFVDNGGSLVVMEEPTLSTEFGDAHDYLADYLKNDWGIILGLDFVIDANTQFLNFAVAFEYGNHPIIQKLIQGVTIYFPTARSVQFGDHPENVLQQLLVSTTPFERRPTWAETDLDGLLAGDSPEADEETDLLGPVPIAAAASNLDGDSKVVVIGDSDFATNGFFDDQTNGTFLVSSIDWITGQENIIQLSAKPQTSRSMIFLTQQSLKALLLTSICILPGGILVGGVVVWFNRRRRG
ncbi:MAG: GldG family protein [Anaerolineae bacterium]|nr:GldG family protein [Anaerolineae bacterium]